MELKESCGGLNKDALKKSGIFLSGAGRDWVVWHTLDLQR